VQSKSKALLAMLAAGGLVSACGGGVSGGSGTTAQLPLKRGFYVASDTACEEASSTTLLLIRQGGFNGARDSCDFIAIEQTGAKHYRVTERCVEIQSGPADGSTQTATWDIPDEATFTSRSESGGERSFRHCEQASLPDPWRDNDISDLLGPPGAQ
jgi:hypothetical protein